MQVNQFAKAAKKAVEFYLEHTVESPHEAWQKAIIEFSTSDNVQNKSCPRNTFLGLCSDGFVKGIPQNDYNKPDNFERIYAQKAVEILRNNSSLADSPSNLWAEIGNADKCHDSQMDIVCALWKEGLLNG
jgi:hypothetical protein